MFTGPAADAVHATLAIHRLEGWRPEGNQVDALYALVGGEVSFADYLGSFRGRYPPPQRRRRRFRIRRPVPYFVPGTTVLRNEFGATSTQMLTELEFVATAGRMVLWLHRPTGLARDDHFDTRVVHHHLFRDVYAWAGNYRTTELRRGAQGFAPQATIAARMTMLNQSIRTLAADGAAHDTPRLAYELARIYADYNHIHPFREGNGRTGALVVHALAQGCGRRLDLTTATREQWYAAAADSMPFRRDGNASHRPFLYLLGPAVTSVDPSSVPRVAID